MISPTCVDVKVLLWVFHDQREDGERHQQISDREAQRRQPSYFQQLELTIILQINRTTARREG